VLFRVAAGRRTGYGHLVRALALADALGVEPVLSVRSTPAVAASLASIDRRARCVGHAALDWRAWDVLVVDDPKPVEAARWIARARRAGVPTVSLHDLGLGAPGADLVVDGSVGAPYRRWPGSSRVLEGPRYAVLRPDAHRVRRGPGRRGEPVVLISLGGGPRARLALAIARAVCDRVQARVEVAFGFGTIPEIEPHDRRRGIRSVPSAQFRRRLGEAHVAVLAGGVSLYEGCAAGVACVGVAVVDAQRPTLSAFADRGCVVNGGLLHSRSPRGEIERLARRVAALVVSPHVRDRLSLRGRRLVDARGAARVAAAVVRLVDRRSRGGRA
jgi:spore coat polysaccharide biosynthesis predicted glycosyltransferase SpsG